MTRRTITVYHAREDREPDAEAEARHTQASAHMREFLRSLGEVVGDYLLPGQEVPVTLIHDGTVPVEWNGIGKPDGWLVPWTTDTKGRITDDPEPVGEVTRVVGEHGRPAAVVVLPIEVTREGGGHRIRHDLDGPVSIYAKRADGSNVGYRFTTPIDENVEHIELLPGVARLYVQRDPDPDPVPEPEPVTEEASG